MTQTIATYRVHTYSDDHVVLLDSDGCSVAEARKDNDGMWVSAMWNHMSGQFTSRDINKRRKTAQYCYSYGQSLTALRRIGCKAYRTATACLRSVAPQPM